MKHKQNSSDAWKKIGIATVLIVAAFGFLLFLEGKMTGMAPKSSTITAFSSVYLPNDKPVVQYSVPGNFTLTLIKQNYTGVLEVSANLKNVTFTGTGKNPLYNLTVLKGGSSPGIFNLNQTKVQVKYLQWKYDSAKKISYPKLQFKWLQENALNLSSGALYKKVVMVGGGEDFFFKSKKYTGLAIGEKTYSFKMLMDPSGEVAVYFNKLGDYVELNKSTTFLVENNGEVKVTVWGTDKNMNLLADVQWIKPHAVD